jgi:phosphomevalonate kinase
MRVQEHIYQGFFGLKKKQDAGKYYHERMEKLKGMDKELDTVIEEFQKILSNHDVKLKSYYNFVNKPGKDTLQAVRKEIEKLEGMFDEDELANDKEQKYVLKGIDELKDLTKNEESSEMGQLESEVVSDLNELLRLLRSIEPVWQAQIDFIKKNDEEILENKINIKVLSDILKEEGDILRMEESILQKIDLKTRTILRKTSLKEQDIGKTEDASLRYRDIRYIR